MIPIQLLESDNNKRGDLFNRFARDLFHSLGYDAIRLNVGKAGREIDLQGKHRLEKVRYLRAECKATRDLIGGADINKFAGALDAERSQLRAQNPSATLAGYFVSLSGFKDSAIEQEDAIEPPRLTLLTGQDALDQLIRARIIVGREQAIDLAARSLPTGSTLRFLSCSLLIHRSGTYWALYYGDSPTPTHMTIIHGAGVALGSRQVEQVIVDSKDAGVNLHLLHYIQPPETSIPGKVLSKANECYLDYLRASCGDIQLDGLPADEQIGARRLRLESLFVPLNVVANTEEPQGEESLTAESILVPGTPIEVRKELKDKRMSRRTQNKPTAQSALRKTPVGEVLASDNRIAILAAPGGGKSTLLKRLAVAYAFPGRRSESADLLPERDWFPLFVRCRELGDAVREPFRQILSRIAVRAELAGDAIVAFDHIVSEALASGKALLLVDGLDEITDDGDRLVFVASLRTFIATYPSISVVVTSREAGFRAVAGAMASACSRYKLADLGDKDIHALTQFWHTEVYGDSDAGRQAATDLAESIISNDRIRLLAGNPLLLTTLLLVKRWVGQLPTRRTVLYDKAIEVLLMTWNVQAHKPIGLEEALPRLEFIAFSMLQSGEQTISGVRLRALLKSARKELPEALGYSQLSDTEFINRIEFRSSLLVQSGHTVEDGRLSPVYEFRHLTFQEYLAARAIVEGHYPGREDSDVPAVVLEPFYGQENWSEVIPMTSVLAGRDARAIVRALIERAELDPERGAIHSSFRSFGHLVVQCLLDEPQLAPTDVDAALSCAVKFGIRNRGMLAEDERNIRLLAAGKFGRRLEEVARLELGNAPEDRLPIVAGVLANASIVVLGIQPAHLEGGVPELSRLRQMLLSDDQVDQAAAALVLMEIAYTFPSAIPVVEELATLLVRLVTSDSKRTRFAATWAVVWLGTNGWRPSEKVFCSLLRSLAMSWTECDEAYLNRQVVWAIAGLPVFKPGLLAKDPEIGHLVRHVEKCISTNKQLTWPAKPSHAATTIAYYLGKPWPKGKLADQILKMCRDRSHPVRSRGREMLANLGVVGSRRLARLPMQRDDYDSI